MAVENYAPVTFRAVGLAQYVGFTALIPICHEPRLNASAYRIFSSGSLNIINLSNLNKFDLTCQCHKASNSR